MNKLYWELPNDNFINGFWVNTMFYNPDFHTWDEYNGTREHSAAKLIELLSYE